MSAAITDLQAKYTPGERPEFTLTFTTSAGALVDPTAITVVVRTPAGTETSYTSGAGQITKLSLGVWQFIYPTGLPNIPGDWFVRTTSTGTVTAEIAKFEVAVSPFTTA